MERRVPAIPERRRVNHSLCLFAVKLAATMLAKMVAPRDPSGAEHALVDISLIPDVGQSGLRLWMLPARSSRSVVTSPEEAKDPQRRAEQKRRLGDGNDRDTGNCRCSLGLNRLDVRIRINRVEQVRHFSNAPR